ncbi:OLC1v1032443C1 [Oldenlandia corymbosa var. corymbosa]|uniref:tRNA(adenine(34)) deaminase n=1 Tax=Oldenlandia corymbosa var. corymbosa TaxID=529605 RepID=A0AAV1CKT3_OLDCO|nr:OLC1v1032443C1 [Oldenlandia corymbosa var. corymbosa]
MNNCCMSSTVSLRYRAPVSFSFNDYSACFNDGFDGNPLLYASPCCSCCCSNSLYCRAPIASPSCIFGLRQSNLIQWSTRKRLVLNGLDRCSYGRYPVCDVDSRPFCEKDHIFNEGRVGGKGRKMGKGRFRRMVYGEKIEWDGSDGRVNEVEVMLSLLTGDVDDECDNVGEEGGKSYRKIEVLKRGSKGDNVVRRRKKNVDSGVLDSRSEFQYESEMIGSEDGEMRRKEKNRREKETGVLLGRENVKVRREEDRANSRQEVLKGEVREEERMNHLRGNRRERSRIEERENLSRIQDHRQRVRKDGSSCSSYYSVTSDDFEIDNEMQHEEEEFEEGISGSYKRDSKNGEAIVSHEGKEEFHGHGNYSGEHGFAFRKENAQTGFSGASSSVEYDWRKKSEKKLSDSSFQGTKSSEEIVQQHSSHGQVDSRKTFGSYSHFDDKKKQLTSTVAFDEEIGQRNDVKIGSETRMKSKESRGRLETHDTDVKTYSTTGKRYTDRDEGYYKSQSSVRNESAYHNASGQINKEETYRKSSGASAKTSKLQEVDIRGTSTAVRQSGIKIMSQEDHVKTTASSSRNSEEQRYQSSEVSEQLDLSKKYQNVSEEIDSERTSLLRRENDVRMKRQEIGSNSSYNSHQKLRDQRSERTGKQITAQQSHTASQETIDLSITPFSKTEASVLEDDGKNTGDEETLSQMAGRGSTRSGSASVSATEEAAGEKFHGSFSGSQKHTLDRSQGFHYQGSHESIIDDQRQPSKTKSDEDRLASADRLQKSSSHFVGDFVQKVRNEISGSELYDKRTYGTKISQEDELSSRSSHGSKVPEPKEQESKSSPHSPETKGPSDQSWNVAEQSTQEPPKAEEIGNGSTSGKENVRRTGKSLWRMIGDIVLLRWHSRSETQSLAAKSGGKNSPNQSTSSDTWFSGHDPEETIDLSTKSDRISLVEETTDLSTKSDRISLVEESTSTDYRQGLTSYVNQGELLNASNTQGGLKLGGAVSMDLSVVSEKDSSVKNISLPSAGAISPVKESSVLLPSPEDSVSPVVERISKEIEGQGSSSGTSSQIEQPFPSNEKSRTDGNNAEVKRRKFGRADQVSKDKFDEWEEAYRLETEQRRIDETFMREALLEAKKAADSWEVPVGAVLVRDGKIIARGFNLVEEMRDSTAHAEIICIREASNVLRTWRLSDTTLYVTLEPCPMCAGAILQARIDTVVWGAPNKLLGADGSWIRLFPNGEGGNEVEPTDKPAPPVHPFHPKIAVRRRVLAAECADTMQQFFQLRRRKDKKREEEPTTPPSCLPITHHPSKFLHKMHHAFHGMFCL